MYAEIKIKFQGSRKNMHHRIDEQFYKPNIEKIKDMSAFYAQCPPPSHYLVLRVEFDGTKCQLIQIFDEWYRNNKPLICNMFFKELHTDNQSKAHSWSNLSFCVTELL